MILMIQSTDLLKYSGESKFMATNICDSAAKGSQSISPCQNYFANKFLCALVMETKFVSTVDVVHQVEDSVGSQYFVTDITHQHHLLLILEDGGDIAWPYFQPINTNNNTDFFINPSLSS